MMMPLPDSPDLVVFGDEVESVLTAVSAARCGARVALVRSDEGWLGGLSTRGGLAYMDLTPEYTAPLFREFLTRAGVVRVALEPHRGDQALRTMLDEVAVAVWDEPSPHLSVDADGQPTVTLLAHQQQWTPQAVIDATPDADLLRMLGIPYSEGLAGLLGPLGPTFLGVTPVFRLAGMSRTALMAFEATLRARPEMPGWLSAALPHLSPDEREALLHRPVYAPVGLDYVDILNPVVGVAFHVWRTGSPEGYPAAETWIDGANIACLPDGTLSWNGLVARPPEDLETLLQWSRGAVVPAPLLEAMHALEGFLRAEARCPDLRVLPPDRLYVRQTVTLHTRQNMSAAQMFAGGVPVADAIGTYSYWIDLRGVTLRTYFPDPVSLPKPIFNVGLDVARFDPPAWSRLGVVSRSAGYSPLGQGAGRIVQHNAMLGEGMGIAAALSAQQGRPINVIAAADVRAVMDQRARLLTGRPLPLEGQPTWTPAFPLDHPLLIADAGCVPAPALVGG